MLKLFTRNSPSFKFVKFTKTYKFNSKTFLRQKPLFRRHFTTNQQTQQFSEGQIVHGWKINKVQYIPEFKFTTYKLEHVATGAQYFHIDAPNELDNAFSIAFETRPPNSQGIPHVLEHTTLCGSQKYPVRDPFFNMLRRSLNTYMNAWTAPDFTAYPFSTQNQKDFYNLMSVYLDATLFPRLLESDFKQEGHRLEFENISDPSSKLLFKGVVFNEMKGAMGDPNQLFSRRLNQFLYPGTPYEYNSGGDPEEIVKMKYEDLRKFHSEHYHPSRAKIFTYGNFPLEKHLEFINQHGFDKFKKIEGLPPLPKAVRYEKPVRVKISGPMDPMAQDPSKQVKFATSYLTDTQQDAFETFALSFLCTALIDEPRGPFYKALIESGLAPDFAPGTGFDYMSESNFSIGVQGISEDEIEKIEKVIHETFEKVAKEGIEKSLIESELHNIELSIKAKTSHFGIHLCHQVIQDWIYTGDPVEAFMIDQKIQRLREELAKGDFFGKMIKKYFLNNNHKVTLIMVPDQDYTKKQHEQEEKLLSEIEKQLTEEQKKKIVEETQLLKQAQEAEQDKSCLPTLTLDDIQRKLPNPINLKITGNTNNIYYNEQDTNGIVYVTSYTPISTDLPPELKKYVPLFAYVLTKIGARDMNHTKLAEEIELHTGGISARPILIPSLKDHNGVEFGLQISSYCLERNTEKMLDLMSAIYNEPKLMSNNQLLKTLIDQSAIEMANSILESGHKFAIVKAGSSITRIGQMQEQWEGYTLVNLINELSRNGNVEEIAEALQSIAKHVLKKHRLRVLLTTEASQRDKSQKAVEKFLSEIPNETVSHSTALEPFTPKYTKTYLSVPSTINFTSSAVLTVPYLHTDYSVLNLAANLISSCYLHKEIRESGGAYGSGASQKLNGIFTFMSYRDPHVLRSLQVFNEAADWVASGKFTNKELDEAKLQVFQRLDAPQTPPELGYTEFFYGITNEQLQKRRDAVLDASRGDILDACVKYLDVSNNKQRSYAVVGTKDKIPEQIVQSEEWQVIDLNLNEENEESVEQ